MRAALRTRGSTRKRNLCHYWTTHGINFKRPFSTESNKEENGWKELSGGKLLLFKFDRKQITFSYIRIAIAIEKIFKNSVFSKNSRLCSRQNRVVIWPTDLTARDLLSRCVMFCWSMTRIALLFFICDQRNTAMFRFVSFRFVIFRFANLGRWICYAFFFFIIDTIECIVNISVILNISFLRNDNIKQESWF